MRKINLLLMTALLAGVSFAQETAVVVEETDVVVAETADVTAIVEESRDLYVAGEFAKAQAGFEQAIALDPEDITSRMYLRKLHERDYRDVEVNGMQAITEAWDTSLVLRSYAISADAAQKMNLQAAEGAVDVSSAFPEVSFPKGATAMYQPAMEKLFIRNTRENLVVIEEVLDAMDVSKMSTDIDQVEIEAKFVEVSEGTLEELGFEWSLTDGTISLGGDVEIEGEQGLFSEGLRGNPSGQAMPFSQPSMLGAGAVGASGDWTALRFEDGFSANPDSMHVQYNGSKQIDLWITALDQSSGADVLSAPRVVTKSGETATIRVGDLHTFPEVYEPAAGGGTIVYVKYDDWEERLLGVELEVTPQVDGDQIELGLNPKFLELQGWQNYSIVQADESYNYYQYRLGNIYKHEGGLTASLPIFQKREIETEVTLADGATMVMGGLINEKVEAYEDSVPLLGSLPLVGRLFRSEGERVIKRNLMMFVTATKVDPSGRASSMRSFE